MIKKDQYESIADCIRSDQVSAPEVVELFEDGKFLKWYRKKYKDQQDSTRLTFSASVAKEEKN